jgi:hypothetical protein
MRELNVSIHIYPWQFLSVSPANWKSGGFLLSKELDFIETLFKNKVQTTIKKDGNKPKQ